MQSNLFTFTIVFATIFSLCLPASPDSCPFSLTVDQNYTLDLCTRTARADLVQEWRCPELQPALEVVVNGSISTDCVSLSVPAGDHFVTEPVHFGDMNVHFLGQSDSSNGATIFCNYTLEVDESRVLDLNYSYTDYTFYFNNSQAVSFEQLQFVGCPYPIRVDTVADVKIHNSTFR